MSKGEWLKVLLGAGVVLAALWLGIGAIADSVKPPPHVERFGEVECFQQGQSILKAKVRQVQRGVWFTYYDMDGNELHLPEGCVKRLKQAGD
jgi:hypothetical protein